MHSENLVVPQVTPLPPDPNRFLLIQHNHMDHRNNENVASSLNKLATTLDIHYENELRSKAEKLKKKEEKQYDNLSEVQKTIIKLITTKVDQTDSDIGGP